MSQAPRAALSKSLTVAVMLLASMTATALSACSPGTHTTPAHMSAPDNGASSEPAILNGGEPAPALKDLVLDSWVASGRGGFFVSNAWDRANPAFSLYSTLWAAELDKFSGVSSGLDVNAVARWTESALSGQQQGSGLPAVAQISYSTRLLTLLGARVSTAPVTRALESLRAGGMYRVTPTTSPDWGSTTVAVQALQSVGSPVPSNVVQAYRQALVSARPSGLDAQSVTNQWIPILKGAIALRDKLGPRELSAAAALVAPSAVAAATLPAGVVRLADTLDLQDIAKNLAVTIPDPRVSNWCGSFVDPSGRVVAPGVDPGDPQVTLTALRLGCPHVAVPKSGAPSRSGWPTPTAMDSRLRSSVAGYRVARAIGIGPRFASALRWSALHDVQPDPADPFRTLEFAQLQSDLGLPVTSQKSPVIGATPRPDALLAWSITAELSTGSQRDQLVAAITQYSRQPAEPDILRAALFEEASRLTGVRDWHDQAVAALTALRAPDGSYRVATGRPGASLPAEAVSAWIKNTSLSMSDLTRLRLCQGWICGEQPVTAQSAPSPSLTDLAAQLSCSLAGCGGIFPLVL